MAAAPRCPEDSAGSIHVPVLVREVLQYLDLHPGLTCVDATVGGGGHSRQILKSIGPTGTLIGLDRDPMMLEKAASVLELPNCHLRQGSYVELPRILEELGLSSIDRALLDLGMSSDQLADEQRGFAFESTGRLDMRYDPSSGEPAWRLLERLPEQELDHILREFGEERFHRRIAREIVACRRKAPVRTASELVALVARALPKSAVHHARKEPATRVFQALRIAVNDELQHLQRALDEVFPKILRPSGVLVVIAFHSLEDRIVKQGFRRDPRWHTLTPKPITASRNEQNVNPRCRSAKLRAAKIR